MSPVSPEEHKILKKFQERIRPNDPSAHNNLAIVYYQRGLVEDALTEFKKALDINPDMRIARRNLQIVLKKTRKMDDFIDFYQRRLAKHPSNIQYHLELAQSYYQLGKYPESAREYKKILLKETNNLNALKGLARAKKKMGLFQESLATLRRANRIDENDPEILRNMGEVYYNLGLYDKAIKVLKSAIRIDSNSAEAHLFLSFTLGETGNVDNALDEAIRAKELDPSLSEVTGALGIEEEVIKPEDELKESFGISSLDTDPFMSRLELAIAYKNKLFISEAKQELEKALKIQPDSPEALKLKAEIHLIDGEYDETLKILEELKPRDFHIWNMLSCAYLLKNLNDKAFRILESITTYPYALNNFALLHITKNREKAIELLRESARTEPGFTIPFYNLAILAIQEENLPLSEKYLRELYEVQSRDPYVLTTFAYVLIKQNKNDEAENVLRETLQIYPEQSEAALLLRDIYRNTKREESAREIEKNFGEIETKNFQFTFLLSIAGVTRGIPYFPQTLKPARIKVTDVKKEINKAKLLIEEGNLDDAEKLLHSVIYIQPENKDALYLLGILYERMGLIDSAENMWIKLKKIFPDPRVRFKLSKLYARTGRFEEAEREIKRILSGKKVYPDVLLFLAEIKEKRGEYDETLKILQTLMRYKKRETDIIIYSGSILEKIGRLEESKKAFKGVLNIDPANPNALYYLGKIAIKENNLQEAKYYENELSKRTEDGAFLYLLQGEIMIKEGNYAEAVFYLEKAVKKNPWWVYAQYYLGVVYALTGRHEKAIECWSKVVKIDKYDEFARKAEEYIKTTLNFLTLLKKGTP